MKKRVPKNGLTLDLGCGKGRNSIFLASEGLNVYSIDFVPELVEELQEQSEVLGLNSQIHPICHNLTHLWPFASKTFDLVIDAYCYKHQVETIGKEIYRSELARVMKSGGLYLLTLAGIDDGYYGPLLSSSPDLDRKLIIDPITGISSILYTKSDIEGEFASSFELVRYECERQVGPMHGGIYQRNTLVFIFSRQE